jgi:P-type Mg2+ transporter
LNDLIIEGRRCFANIMKYIVMGSSSNFWKYVQHGCGIFVPAIPANAADPDPTE